MTSLANPSTGLARVAISGFTSVTPKLDSLVNEVIRSFSLNTLILLNDVITMKLVYRLTIEHTYTYYSRPRSPRLGVVPAWFSPGLQFYRGNIWSLEGVGYTSPQEAPLPSPRPAGRNQGWSLPRVTPLRHLRSPLSRRWPRKRRRIRKSW